MSIHEVALIVILYNELYMNCTYSPALLDVCSHNYYVNINGASKTISVRLVKVQIIPMELEFIP